MDSRISLYLDRAENEIFLSEIILKISNQEELKEQFGVSLTTTFYSGVISHAYYAIFYTAKAYLLSKKIRTTIPHEHHKVYMEFAKLVKKGIVAKELLEIYEDVSIKADFLLKILEKEKKNRKVFTYDQMPQANKQPASESFENSKKFFKHLQKIITNIKE